MPWNTFVRAAAVAGVIAMGFGFAVRAHAQETALCRASASSHDYVIGHGGQWIELTANQRLFVAGLYVMNPDTPKGLPFGDKAVMATLPEKSGALIFFMDGDTACTPMPLPKEIVDLLADVATGVVTHPGASN